MTCKKSLPLLFSYLEFVSSAVSQRQKLSFFPFRGHSLTTNLGAIPPAWRDDIESETSIDVQEGMWLVAVLMYRHQFFYLCDVHICLSTNAFDSRAPNLVSYVFIQSNFGRLGRVTRPCAISCLIIRSGHPPATDLAIVRNTSGFPTLQISEKRKKGRSSI